MAESSLNTKPAAIAPLIEYGLILAADVLNEVWQDRTLEEAKAIIESFAPRQEEDTGLASDKSPVRPTSDSDSPQSASTREGF